MVINVLGEIGSPCLVPIVVKNHSPISLPTLTVDFDLSPMFRKIPTNRFPTPYDLNVAQVTSCLMPKNHITSQNAVYNSPLKENRIFYDDDEDENDNNRNRNLKTSKALL